MNKYLKIGLYVAGGAALSVGGYVAGRIHQHGIDVGRAQAAAAANDSSPAKVAAAVEAKAA